MSDDTIRDMDELAFFLAKRDGGFKCRYTGVELTMADYCIDHIRPLYHGGADNCTSNFCLVEKTANRRKWHRWGLELVDTEFEIALAPVPGPHRPVDIWVLEQGAQGRVA